jgi:hypothetical protein
MLALDRAHDEILNAILEQRIVIGEAQANAHALSFTVFYDTFMTNNFGRQRKLCFAFDPQCDSNAITELTHGPV